MAENAVRPLMLDPFSTKNPALKRWAILEKSLYENAILGSNPKLNLRETARSIHYSPFPGSVLLLRGRLPLDLADLRY